MTGLAAAAAASTAILLGFFISLTSCDDIVTDLIKTGELRKACPKSGNAPQPPSRVFTLQRVTKLRSLMVNETVTRIPPIDAYIIPSQDEHQNEFVEDYDKRLQYISGFSGSYGDAVITNDTAVLWTDSRYHLQADDQIDCHWRLMRENFVGVPTLTQWLHQTYPSGGVLGADPKLVAQYRWDQLSNELRRTNWTLVEVQTNLIDVMWTTGRPPRRNKNVFVLKEKYSGKPWTKKVEEVRGRLRRLHVDAMVVTALDEIAWLLNIRGRDIPSNPFVRSYLLLDMNRVKFYVNQSQLVDNNVFKYFDETRTKTNEIVEVIDYGNICEDLKTWTQTYTKILIPSQCGNNWGASRNITRCIPKEQKRFHHQSPIILLKARKNPVEIRGMQKAHIRDAAAMCKFFAYLDNKFQDGTAITELDVVKIVDEYRFEQEYSLGNSFRTIAAYGPNGALPHYEPTNNTNAKITDKSTLVLDSGGQYLDGTTDVTRTLHFGTPTKEQKEAYTRVLIGQIQLSMLTFPDNLKSSAVDVMARAPLWEAGLDYGHSTSHGVGSFSSVHEAPISVYFDNPLTFPENEKLRPGYFLSNEPGYYGETGFGIRLENVMEVIEKRWLKHKYGRTFLGFKTVTLVPYEPKLIDLGLLSVHQIRWLNNYNDKIRIQVGAELKRLNFTEGFYWMMDRTKHFYGTGNVNKTQSILLLLVLLVSTCSNQLLLI
jgi:Xaa-Pro aminopeptidase